MKQEIKNSNGSRYYHGYIFETGKIGAEKEKENKKDKYKP